VPLNSNQSAKRDFRNCAKIWLLRDTDNMRCLAFQIAAFLMTFSRLACLFCLLRTFSNAEFCTLVTAAYEDEKCYGLLLSVFI